MYFITGDFSVMTFFYTLGFFFISSSISKMLPSFEFRDALHPYMGELSKELTCKRVIESFFGFDQ